MDFIRNLFTLFQRLHEIVRDGQKRGDIPGMAMAVVREVRGADRDSDGQGDGPVLYQGKRAQAEHGTPEAASRATARNKASRNSDLPEPAVYRSPDGANFEASLETARAPARNADDADEKTPKPATAPLTREEYDYQPASASPSQEGDEPEFEPASAEPSEAAEPVVADQDGETLAWDEEVSEPEPVAESTPEPVTDEEPGQDAAPPAETAPVATSEEAEKKDKDKDGDEDWFDLDDWQGTAMKVAGLGAAAAGTAAGAMAIKNHFFDDDDEDGARSKPALPLGGGDEPSAGDGDDDKPDDAWKAAAAVAAPAIATVLPTIDDEGEGEGDAGSGDGEQAREQRGDAPTQQPRRPHPVEIIPADPRNPATQPASQSLASPGIRLYGTMDAGMYAEFTEMLAEQAPGGPIVIALTTMEGDPEIARSMADDIRLLRDRGRREIIFLGKTAVYGAGVLFMAAFPVSHRYLTRATKLLVTENKRAQPLELAGGSLRSVASQLEHAQREIQREIAQEDEDYRAISEGSNVSVQELREKAPNDWYITASEAKAMGLIIEVV